MDEQFIEKLEKNIRKNLDEIQEKAKNDFGKFLDDVSEFSPLIKKFTDKIRIKWKV